MFKKIVDKLFPGVPEKPAEKEEKRGTFLSTHTINRISTRDLIEQLREKVFQVMEIPVFTESGRAAAMDSVPTLNSVNGKAFFNINTIVSPSLMSWYAAQSFIGYQACAIIAQHWLVEKCCSMPAKDATSAGYEVTINDGTKIEKKIQDALRQADLRLGLMESLVDFVTKGRMYGIRIGFYDMKVNNPKDYYVKPYNPDSVKPGMYRGIIQVDPFWLVGQLDQEAAANPASKRFYKPTWWQIGGLRIHYTHLCIFQNGHLADTLKPTYQWGSVSVPQRIYERVYCSERTANEAPLLALTKRMDVYKTDLTEATAQGAAFIAKMEEKTLLKNNYGTNIIGEGETIERFDTSLNDLDAVIMTQFQLNAAICDVPATQLLGTSPKGFNSTGEHELAVYRKFLEGIETHHLTPLLMGHYERLIRSEIAPKFGISPFEITIVWNKLDAMTELEKATVNKVKADTDAVWKNAGAVDENDIRDRLILDPESGYSGIPSGAPGPPEQEVFGDDYEKNIEDE